MLDNVAGLMLMVGLLSGFGFPTDFAVSAMVPGTALGVMVGDLAFFFIALRLAKRTGRDDVTAMPLGLDTPSTFGIVLFILGTIVPAGPGDGAERDGCGLPDLAHRDLVHRDQRRSEARLVPVRGVGSTGGTTSRPARIAGCDRFGADQLPAADGNPGSSAAGDAGDRGRSDTLWSDASRFPGELLERWERCSCRASSSICCACIPGTGYDVSQRAPRSASGFPTSGCRLGSSIGSTSSSDALAYVPIALPFAIATVVGGIDCTESAAAAGDEYDTRTVIAVEAFATCWPDFPAA